jgi:hypothetical protein
VAPYAGDEEDMLMAHAPLSVFLRYETVGLAWGSLRKLDLADISVPIRELETYMTARFQDRFGIKPSSFEKIDDAIEQGALFCNMLADNLNEP